jgi:hypothetical protein
MREGMNLDCRWPSEPAFPLDPNNAEHVHHLLDDLQVAEELSIRYADRTSGRRPVSVLGLHMRTGMTASGQLLPRLRDECSTTLFGTIADTHGLTRPDVLAARLRLGDKGADLAVNGPMAMLYGLVAVAAIRRVRRRFQSDEKWASLVALALASVMVSASIVLVGHLWAGAVEAVRLGNEHLSYRAERLSWPQHRLDLFVLGVVAFWVLALLHRRTAQPTGT